MNVMMFAPGRAHPVRAPRVRCIAAAALVIALCATTAKPATAQAGATPAARPPTMRLPLPPRPEPTLWQRIRAEIERAAAAPLLEFRYASRYGVSSDLANTITRAARAEGVDPELGFRLIRVESEFNPHAVSRVGASGLMQLMPGTFRSYRRLSRGETALFDPETNLRVGFRYLRQLLDMFNGDVRLAVTAYNRGEGSVLRSLRRGERPQPAYTRVVLGLGSANPYRGPGRIEPSDSSRR